MISKRISDTACNEEEFNKAAPVYNNALKNSIYLETITQTTTCTVIHKKGNRTRNIIWFNPPYNENVETLEKNFYCWRISIFLNITDYTKFATVKK